MPEDVPDLYAVIGAKRWAKQPALARAYHRRLAVLQKLGEDTEELETAFAMLSDPVTRKEYGDLLFASVTDTGFPSVDEMVQDAYSRHGVGHYIVLIILSFMFIGMIIAAVIQSAW